MPREIRSSRAFGILGAICMWDVGGAGLLFIVGIERKSELCALPAASLLGNIIVYVDGLQGSAGLGCSGVGVVEGEAAIWVETFAETLLGEGAARGRPGSVFAFGVATRVGVNMGRSGGGLVLAETGGGHRVGW